VFAPPTFLSTSGNLETAFDFGGDNNKEFEVGLFLFGTKLDPFGKMGDFMFGEEGVRLGSVVC